MKEDDLFQNIFAYIFSFFFGFFCCQLIFQTKISNNLIQQIDEIIEETKFNDYFKG